MSKILTAKEFLKGKVGLQGAFRLNVYSFSTEYASYIAQEFAEWIIRKGCSKNHKAWVYECQVYTSEQLFDLFKKENGL